MASDHQLTEISKHNIADLVQFYRYNATKYPFLLSSTSATENSTQEYYDILFIDPLYYIQLDEQFNVLSNITAHHIHGKIEIDQQCDFLTALDHLFVFEQKQKTSEQATQSSPNYKINLPFTGGWFTFFSYEFAQQLESSLKQTKNTSDVPIAYAARIKKALIYRHKTQQYYFVTENQCDHQQAYQDLLKDIKSIKEKLSDTTSNAKSENPPWSKCLGEEKPHTFLDAVPKVREYIKEGDVFQVNLSRLWLSEPSQNEHSIFNHIEHSADLYESLALANPAPFSGLAHFHDWHQYATIISSSPERLLKVQQNKIESRPIAGTRPRDLSSTEDQRLLSELHGHPKEQAEHVMLIDLIRNDLGRVCQPGSVNVDEFMINESYTHVHHIVSNIVGQLKKEVTPGDIIRALFPGGTITGCPKIRCMQIIAELEQANRGAYTGSMGYININGDMDLNILIRSMTLTHRSMSEKEQLSFRAGSGLVFDSLAENELLETRAKAKGMIASLENQATFIAHKKGSF